MYFKRYNMLLGGTLVPALPIYKLYNISRSSIFISSSN